LLLFAPHDRQELPSQAQDASSRRSTSGVQDTHKTSDREVHYSWHLWYGQQVHIQVEARRIGGVELRCVQGEVNTSPALEMPNWMFDAGLGSGMKQDSLAHVSVASLAGAEGATVTGNRSR